MLLRSILYTLGLFLCTGSLTPANPHAAQAIFDQFSLTKVTFSSDVLLTEDEFFYLTGLKTNVITSKKKIESCLDLLMQKKSFKEFSLTLAPYDSGMHAHISLTGYWVIKKVRCKGILFGKDVFLGMYSQQPGDVFNSTLHEESLAEIGKALCNDGYFDYNIDDEIIYDHRCKHLVINFTIDRKLPFTINHVAFTVSPQESSPELAQALTSQFSATLETHYYTKTLIDKQAQKIKKYLQEEGYNNNRITFSKTLDKETKTINLVFSINLGVRFLPSFRGNSLFSNKMLLKKLNFKDQPDWLLSPTLISEQITYEYFKNGYWDTKVTTHESSMGAAHEHVFVIDEGAPSYIQSVRIVNAQTGKIERVADGWSPIQRKTLFDKSLLTKNIKAFEQYCISQGFWDAAIVQKRYIKKADNRYTVLLLANKGVQRFWGTCEIKNFAHLEEEAIFKKSDPSARPIPFNVQWLQDQKTFLMNHFQKLGYWYVTVKPTFTLVPFDNDSFNPKAKVSISWKITPGKHIQFGKTIFRGNSTVPFKRLIKEITFQENELWDKNKLEQTRKKLKRFDIFQQVHIQPLQLATQSTKKPVVITLIEEDPVELRFRAGYFLTNKNFLFKRESTPKLGTTVIIRNPTNRADKVTLDADFTRFERNINCFYQQPSFLNLPITGKIEGFSKKYIHPIQVASSTSAYEAIQNGFLCSVSNEYRNNYFWAFTVGNEWQKTSRVRGNLKLDPSMIDKTVPYFFIEPSLLIDNVDDKVETTKGTQSFFSFKLLLPERNGSLNARLMTEQSLFYPLHKNIVTALRLRAGHMFRRSFEFIMPLERFYLGGPNSVRGYEKDALPPLGESKIIKDGKERKEFTIQGGSSMVNANFELRFALPKRCGLVLFQDIGALSQSGFLGFKNTWYPSTGFGLRYKTPIGALRFDIGWKWKKRTDNDSGYAWYLTLGEAF